MSLYLLKYFNFKSLKHKKFSYFQIFGEIYLFIIPENLINYLSQIFSSLK